MENVVALTLLLCAWVTQCVCSAVTLCLSHEHYHPRLVLDPSVSTGLGIEGELCPCGSIYGTLWLS